MSTLAMLPARAPGVPLPKPPPARLVGHENLFAYYDLVAWEAHATKPASVAQGSIDAVLARSELPLLSGPALPSLDAGSSDNLAPVRIHPNDSLLAMAFQGMPQPMQAAPPGRRTLTDSHVRALTFTAARAAGGASSGFAGPLHLARPLEAVVSARWQEAMQEAAAARHSGRDARARNISGASTPHDLLALPPGAVAASADTQLSAPTATGVSMTETGKLRLSMKRPAQDGSGGGGLDGAETVGMESEKKRKKAKKKENLVV